MARRSPRATGLQNSPFLGDLPLELRHIVFRALLLGPQEIVISKETVKSASWTLLSNLAQVCTQLKDEISSFLTSPPGGVVIHPLFGAIDCTSIRFKLVFSTDRSHGTLAVRYPGPITAYNLAKYQLFAECMATVGDVRSKLATEVLRRVRHSEGDELAKKVGAHHTIDYIGFYFAY